VGIITAAASAHRGAARSHSDAMADPAGAVEMVRLGTASTMAMVDEVERDAQPRADGRPAAWFRTHRSVQRGRPACAERGGARVCWACGSDASSLLPLGSVLLTEASRKNHIAFPGVGAAQALDEHDQPVNLHSYLFNAR